MGWAYEKIRCKRSSYSWKRYSGRPFNEARRLILEHLVSWWLYLRRISSTFWTWLGNTWKVIASTCMCTPWGIQMRNIYDKTRHECSSKNLVSYPWSSVWIPRNPWLSHFNSRLLHYLGRWQGSLSPNLSLRLPSMPGCCDFFPLIDRKRESSQEREVENHWKGDRFGHWWARSAALWSQQECLLVWFSVRHQNCSRTGSLSECDLSSGLFCSTGRNGLGHRKPWSWVGGMRRDRLQALSASANSLHFSCKRILYWLESFIK